MLEARLKEGKELSKKEMEQHCRYANLSLLSSKRAVLDATLLKQIKGTAIVPNIEPTQ